MTSGEDPRHGYAALVAAVAGRGLLDPVWRRVWEALPRHRFIPSRIWRQGPERCEPVAVGDEWWSLVHSDEPVVVQVDDGAENGPGVATSSNSKPSVVATMLGLLQVRDGERVLEIGTATGHVAALLSERLGDRGRGVHSIEVDPAMAAMAATHLGDTGYEPHLRVGDGERGWPGGEPFDRIVVTCSLRRMPYAFIEQVRPGGTVVAPLYRDFWSGALVQLTVGADGAARGRFRGGASYMPIRAQRTEVDTAVDSGTARSREAGLDPAELLSLGFALYAGARLPGVWMRHSRIDGTVHVWARGEDGSATSTATGEDVWQYGPRDLWAGIEAVHREYTAAGSPHYEDFGLTVTAEGQSVWLREPGAIVKALA
ncbi:methyltransferase [Streptomyces sp. NPDC057307]|uniref:methyltransferase n=1 Tax=Streptomyces sp. NPDC057307 TaxID=3346096 RepID=UPI003633A49F